MNGLDHVAILVSDLDAAIALFRDVYGLALSEVEEVPTEKVKVAIFGHDAGRIELVSPMGPDSPMAKAIEKRGEGLHHICLEVPDIASAMAARRSWMRSHARERAARRSRSFTRKAAAACSWSSGKVRNILDRRARRVLKKPDFSGERASGAPSRG